MFSAATIWVILYTNLIPAIVTAPTRICFGSNPAQSLQIIDQLPRCQGFPRDAWRTIASSTLKDRSWDLKHFCNIVHTWRVGPITKMNYIHVRPFFSHLPFLRTWNLQTWVSSGKESKSIGQMKVMWVAWLENSKKSETEWWIEYMSSWALLCRSKKCYSSREYFSIVMSVQNL